MTSFFRVIKKFSLLFIVIIILAAIFSGYITLQNPAKFPFRKIKIVMLTHQHLDPALIKKVVIENTHGGFFSLQIKILHEALLQMPWVYDVSLRRLWPDELQITVQEQKAVARWGADALLNEQGELFKPALATIPNNLPLLIGPADSQQELWQRLQQFNQLLSPLGLQVTMVNLNARHAWSLILNGHIQVMLGRELIDQRMQHLAESYAQIVGNRQDQVDRIDLRYPNGVAVLWKREQNIFNKH